jgi:hypothetical protein
MPRYRLDEYRFLRGKLTRNTPVWLEEIQFEEDGEIYYTEHYVQISLVKLLKHLKRYNPNIKPMENTLSPAELVQAYLEKKALVESLTVQLKDAETAKNDFDFQIRNQLIVPNEYATLLIDGNILVQLVGGYLDVSRVTRL